MGFEAVFGGSLPSYDQLLAYVQNSEIQPTDHPKIIACIQQVIQQEPNLQEVITLQRTLESRKWSDSVPSKIEDLVEGVCRVMASSLVTASQGRLGELSSQMQSVKEIEIKKSILFALAQVDPLLAAKTDAGLFIGMRKKLQIEPHLQLPIALICAQNAPEMLLRELEPFPGLSPDEIRSVLVACVKSDPEVVGCYEFQSNVSKNILSDLWKDFINEWIRCLSLSHIQMISRYQPEGFNREVLARYVEIEPDLAFSHILGLTDSIKAPIKETWIKQCLVHARDKEGMVHNWISHCLLFWSQHKKSSYLTYYRPQQMIQEWPNKLAPILKELQRPEITRLVLFECAKQIPDYLVEHLFEFGVEEQQVLEELARQCAKIAPQSVSAHITKFRIQSPASLEALALICLEGDPPSLCANIERFAIESVSIKQRIAEKVAVTHPSVLAKEITRFQLDESFRFSLAKRCLEHVTQSDTDFLEHYPQFQLKGLPYQLACAKILLRIFGYQALDLAREVFITHAQRGELDEAFSLAEEAIIHAKGEAIRQMDRWLRRPFFQHLDGSCLLPSDQNRALAELGARIDGYATASQIDTFNITDERVKFRILCQCVEMNPSAIRYTLAFMTSPDWMGLFVNTLKKIEEPAEIVTFILSVQETWKVDPTKRLAIIEECARYCPLIVAKNMGKLRLSDETDRRRIANLCIGAGLAIHIDQFNLSDVKLRARYAEQCLLVAPSATFKGLGAGKFGIPVEKEFELLQRGVGECPVTAVAAFGRFDRFALEQRLELIEGCFRKDPHGTVKQRSFFQSCDEGRVVGFLSRYAEIPAASFPTETLESFFYTSQGIGDEDYKSMGFGTGKGFSLENRYLLAQRFAAYMPSELLGQLSLFKIRDSEKIANILEICFRRDPISIWHFFQKTKYTLPPDKVVSLALGWASTSRSGIPCHFQSLGIPDNEQEKILKIALLSAEHNGAETAKFFANFKLRLPESRSQVVRIIARTAPQLLAQLIDVENIESEEERYHLAQIAVTNSPKALKEFDHWNIEQRQWIDHLIELSERSFPEEFKRECVYVINPRFLPSLERRKQLAELACQYNPCEAANLLGDFHIPNRWDLLSLVVLMAENTDQLSFIPDDCMTLPQYHSTQRYIETWEPDEKKQLIHLFEFTQTRFSSCGLEQISLAHPMSPGFLSLLKEHLFSATCTILKAPVSPQELSVFQCHCYPLIREFLSHHHDLIAPSELPANGEELSLAKLKKVVIAYIGLQVFSEAQLSHSLFYQTFKKLLNLRNSHQAMQYLRILAYKTTPPVLEALTIGTQTALKKGSTERYGKPLAPLLIPMLMVAKWAGECGQPQLVKQLNAIFRVPDIVDRYFKKEATQPHSLMQVWLHTVDQLEKAQELSALRKLKLLIQAATGPEGISSLVDCLNCIQMILTEGQARQLDKDFDEFIEDDLIYLVTQRALKDDTLRLCEVEDIERKYVETLMRLRVPNAWRIYQKKLQETGNSNLLEHYRKFIVSVLNGTFKEERYKTTSPHIEKIRDYDESVWQKWKGGTPSQKIQLRPDKDERFSFSLFVKEKIREGHFFNAKGEELFPQLRAWADGNIAAEAVIEKRQKEQSPLAKVEERVMRLCINQGLSLEALHKELLEIEGLLSGLLSQPVEFMNDLKSLRKILIHPTKSENYQIENTDDWQDLLLSGTEVEGSCQRINGDSRLNQGLIGYLLDGKIRMIVIKNPETGAIEGRAILRILWSLTTKSPVLFLDRKYLNKLRVSMSRAIDQYAKRVAQDLGYPLYKTRSMAEDTVTKNKIVSLGSLPGCEYSDTAGRVTDGRYTLGTVSEII